jgi:Peptidyl-prolyl cis-trans isomerase (rotamase) - cyclophilin family
MIRTGLLSLFATTALLAQTPATTPAAPKAPAREPGLYATINTSMGPIVCILYEKESPITVKNFVALARGGKTWTDPKTKAKTTRPLYSGTIFHRVIPGFMIQGGDPTGTGMGDGGLTPIPDEFSPNLKFDKPGRLAMANAGPRTGTCQFFITEGPTPHLDGKHTIFGQVIEGQDLVTKIARVPKNADDKPNTPVKILNIAIKREGPAPAGSPAPATRKAAPATKKSAAPATKS